MSMFDQIVAFTSRSQGATCAEIAVFVGRDNDSAGSYVRRLEQQGRLFRAKSGRQHLRFFSDKGACAAWLAAEDLKPAEVKVTPRSVSSHSIYMQIEAMANNKNGVSCADVKAKFAMQTATANNRLYDLTVQGRIFRAKRHGLRLLWFKMESLRDEWHLGVSRGDESFIAEPLQPVRNPKPQKQKQKVSAAERFASSAVDESKAKKTDCGGGTHDPRYQVGPTEVPPAVFSGQKYGQYLDPASTWAAAASHGI